MNSKNYKLVTLAIIALLFFNFNITAQVGIGTETPSANAMLDVESTSKGFLPPRMTTAQKTLLGDALTSAASASDEGMTIYDTDLNSYNVWNGIAWVELGSGGGGNVSTSIGNMYFNVAANSTLTTAPSKLNGSGVTDISNSTDFTTSGDNRLTYTGAGTQVFTVSVSISFSRTGFPPFNNQEKVTVFLYNGAGAVLGITGSVGLEPLSTGLFDTEVNVSMTGTVSLATNEYIEIWAQSNFGSLPITVNSFNVVLD